MKYAINPRGRKIRVQDKDLQDLLQKGFVEISQQEFESQKYIKDLDKKSKNIEKTQSAQVKESGFFRTRIV